MSWGAQNRSKDAKTPSTPRDRSEKPEPGLWPVQPYQGGPAFVPHVEHLHADCRLAVFDEIPIRRLIYLSAALVSPR
jgi:hypothetical protein